MLLALISCVSSYSLLPHGPGSKKRHHLPFTVDWTLLRRSYHDDRPTTTPTSTTLLEVYIGRNRRNANLDYYSSVHDLAVAWFEPPTLAFAPCVTDRYAIGPVAPD